MSFPRPFQLSLHAFASHGLPAIAELLVFELGVTEKPRFAVGIVILSVIVAEIQVLLVLAAVYPFLVVVRCYCHSSTLY